MTVTAAIAYPVAITSPATASVVFGPRAAEMRAPTPATAIMPIPMGMIHRPIATMDWPSPYPVSTGSCITPDSCHRGVSVRGDFEGVKDLVGGGGEGVGGGVFVAGDLDGDFLQGA